MRSPRRTRSSPGYLGFKIIGIVKVTSGLLLLAVAVGLFRLIDHDRGLGWEHLIHRLQLDAHSRLFRAVVASISGIDRSHLHLIEAGAFFYAFLHFIEGTGLILERDWAGYLVVVITGSLIPFEFYEIAQNPSFLRISVLLGNTAILVYLTIELVKERREQSRTTAKPQAPSTSA